MTPKEISRIIEKEINGEYSITNAHGVDLKRCLVRPKRRELFYQGEIQEFWIVLEEYPETFEGYKIIFDEETQQFGLAQYWGESKDFVIGLHDSFLKALKYM